MDRNFEVCNRKTHSEKQIVDWVIRSLDAIEAALDALHGQKSVCRGAVKRVRKSMHGRLMR